MLKFTACLTEIPNPRHDDFVCVEVLLPSQPNGVRSIWGGGGGRGGGGGWGLGTFSHTETDK